MAIILNYLKCLRKSKKRITQKGLIKLNNDPLIIKLKNKDMDNKF